MPNEVADKLPKASSNRTGPKPVQDRLLLVRVTTHAMFVNVGGNHLPPHVHSNSFVPNLPHKPGFLSVSTLSLDIGPFEKKIIRKDVSPFRVGKHKGRLPLPDDLPPQLSVVVKKVSRLLRPQDLRPLELRWIPHKVPDAPIIK